jgi:hypothetical protein
MRKGIKSDSRGTGGRRQAKSNRKNANGTMKGGRSAALKAG